jgi:hypothetical protein
VHGGGFGFDLGFSIEEEEGEEEEEEGEEAMADWRGLFSVFLVHSSSISSEGVECKRQ